MLKPTNLLLACALALLVSADAARAEVVDIGPLDDTLTQPLPGGVARNFGVWTDTESEPAGPNRTLYDVLDFAKNGFIGSHYTECGFLIAGHFMHPQHVVRLPNKDGHAYFIVSHSDNNGDQPAGRISVYRSDSPVGASDRVQNLPGTDGRIVWEQHFSPGAFPAGQGGKWNHPCKMDLVGNVLVIAAQNWDAKVCEEGRGNGDPEAVLFYDVRDPDAPRYWGKITQSELSASAGTALQDPIQDVALLYTGPEWVLAVRDHWWRSYSVFPAIENWDYAGTGKVSSAPNTPQHGQNFYSLELPNPVQPQNVSPQPGRRRVMWFDAAAADPDNYVAGDERFWFMNLYFRWPFTFDARSPASEMWPGGDIYRGAPNVGPGDLHYDNAGIYVSGGVPIIYSVHEGFPYDTVDDKIFQIYTPANVWLDFATALDDDLAWTTGGVGTDGSALWYAQSDVSHDGSDAVQTSTIYDGELADLSTTVIGPGNLNFWWKVSSQQNSDYLRFLLDGLEQGSAPAISGEVDWHQRTVAIPVGVHTVRWTYATDAGGSAGSNAAWLDQVSVTTSLAEAVDAYTLWWSSEDFGNWYWQSFETHDGVDAARSASILPLQDTTLVTSVNGPGLISFWWRVSSEANYDFLHFTLDGFPWLVPISGETAWGQQTISIPAGSHTLRWTYEKDWITTAGYDAGFVDQVVWIPATVTTTAETGPGSLRHTLASLAAGSTITFAPALDGQTLTLSTGPIVIGANVTIDASSLPNGLTINSIANWGLIEVQSGTTVSLKGLTLADSPNFESAPGAIYNQGTLTCTNCTISGNTKGITNSGTLTLLNSTVSGNSGAATGAGLTNWGSATLRHTTISGNGATGQGGGIANLGGSTLTLENSIVAKNTAASSVDIYSEPGGTIVPLGANLIGENASVAAEFPIGPLHGEPGAPVDPLLAPLEDYGGSTQTMELYPNSVAVDAAVQSGSSPTADQRGVARPQGIEDDLGAYELSKKVVTNTNDAGPGSLRQAIYDAPARDLIEFDPALSASSTISLLTGQLEIDRNVWIDASRLGEPLTLDAGSASRLFLVNPGAELFLSGLTITGGDEYLGGGVYNNGGYVLIWDSTLTGNTAQYGGALANGEGGTAAIIWSTLAGNSAGVVGGAIYNRASSSMYLADITITGNTAAVNGGGIASEHDLYVSHSTIVDNSAPNFGGGIDNDGSDLTLINSIVAGNSGPAPGSGPDIGNRNGGTINCVPWCDYSVRRGTGEIGEGVQLAISQNGAWFPWSGGEDGDLLQRDGNGFTVGGQIHSPSGAPDLWFRAASSPTFPGALDDLVHWFLGGSYIGGSHDPGIPWEGAVQGTDNWMRVVRNGDGCVSWAQFEFDFSQPPGSTAPVLVEIPVYVRRNDCADFSIADAVAASTVPSTASNLIGNNDTVSAEFPVGPLHGTLASPRAHGLGPLADNGGPTQTRMPLLGSLAIDAVEVSAGTDQRGFPRPVGAAGDLGSVEYACDVASDGDCDGAIGASDNCPTVPNGILEAAVANVGDQTDFDSDAVGDACDNCTRVNNPRVYPGLAATQAAYLAANPWATLSGGQRDDDHDGYGNKCDADFTATGVTVGPDDLTQYRAASGKSRASQTACGAVGTATPPPQRCAKFDLNESAVTIGPDDLTAYRSLSGKAKGPRCATHCTGAMTGPLACISGSATTCTTP